MIERKNPPKQLIQNCRGCSKTYALAPAAGQLPTGFEAL